MFFCWQAAGPNENMGSIILRSFFRYFKKIMLSHGSIFIRTCWQFGFVT